MPLKPGDKAPDFTLLDQDGQPFTLSKSRQQRKVWHFIFFYPKALTGGCTTQACGLRDVLPDIGDTAVLGISPDAPEMQARFDHKHSLGFPLLSDPDHQVADRYGAWGPKKLYGREYEGIIRSAYLVDDKGKIEHAWPKISPKDTPGKLLTALAT